MNPLFNAEIARLRREDQRRQTSHRSRGALSTVFRRTPRPDQDC